MVAPAGNLLVLKVEVRDGRITAIDAVADSQSLMETELSNLN
jgi:hypothetical protein